MPKTDRESLNQLLRKINVEARETKFDDRNNLIKLDLRANRLRHLPPEIGQFTNLTSLILTNNHLIELPAEIGRLTNLVMLDLSINVLRELPPEIYQLTRLISLNLNSTHLGMLPAEIGQLVNLTAIDLGHTQLETLPPSIGKLARLSKLNLNRTELTLLPSEIGRLTNLSELDLSGTKLTNLPAEIGGLSNLTSLSISNTDLKELPAEIGQLSNLTFLNVSNTDLRELPPGLGGLFNLVRLNLSGNKLTSLPPEIGQLKRLSELNLLNASKLKELPPEIGRLASLTTLSLKNNSSLEQPPPEIVAKGVEAIKSYLRQLEKEGKDYLYEAKLLIVGEGGAGKTTLARKINNPNYELKDEESTQGIDVIQWNFYLENGQMFRVNIWDFGGQEIYHATHQFFLTRRSLYALVADTRKEDTDFYYWLNVVELLSDNSPLLIIKNEKQDRHREINERQLRGQFTNLKQTLATNLATNRGLPEILSEIKHYINQLPHVGSSLPKTWKNVRQTIEKDTRNHISFAEYLDICQQNGFVQFNDKLQLSSYLHDLGVCLHFQNDPLLKKTVILKPEWGTAAVYKVLDNLAVIRNLGRFTRSDLSNIWNEDQYANMQDELLQLMINFKLCYKIPETEYYIAPQLLSPNAPNYEWIEVDNLTLRYTYEFMPKGIITQFIVVMHKLIANQRFVWKNGVILRKDNTEAEIIEYYDKREIQIRIAGKHKKELITIVTYELDKIHASYNRLRVHKLIPCNCTTCTSLQKPHFYAFDVLREFISNGQRIIQCQKKPYEMVDVAGLIDDVTDHENLSTGEIESEGEFIFNAPVKQIVIQQSEKGNLLVEKNMRQEKVIKIGNKAQISAPIVIADSIENSFNSLAESNVNDDLKTLLEQLLKAVNEVSKNVSSDQTETAETMARDAETLVKEVTSSKPRRQWYEISIEGLKQAAINIGEVAKPVLEIVGRLVPLLSS